MHITLGERDHHAVGKHFIDDVAHCINAILNRAAQVWNPHALGKLSLAQSACAPLIKRVQISVRRLDHEFNPAHARALDAQRPEELCERERAGGIDCIENRAGAFVAQANTLFVIDDQLSELGSARAE